jgi:hypothetical protein
VVDGLGGQDRSHKRDSSGHIDQFAIPSWKFTGTLVLKVLKVSPPKAPNRKRKTKVSQREGSTRCGDALKHLFSVDIATPDRHDGALQKIGAKAGHLTEVFKDSRKILNITFDWSHKNGRIIRIKRENSEGEASRL